MWNSSTQSGSESSAESMIIDSKNFSKLQFLWDNGEFDRIFNSVTYWTRITIINGASYDKDSVLRAIIQVAIYLYDIVPALYQIEGKDSFFLARNCAKFIKRLALKGFKVQSLSGKGEYELSITTNYLSFSHEPLNVVHQIRSAALKRYNRELKTLDLTNFSEDEYLKDTFFHLNIPQCMTYMMDLIKRETNIQNLVLQHNDLRRLDSLDLKNMNLLQLDLRYNNITWEGFEKLQLRKGSKLNAVWLDGNPLCINLSESDYIKRVDAVLPGVKKIDGVDVSRMFLSYPSTKVFFYNGSWAPFVDHFLHHYFGLLESANRHDLARFYHKKAHFSLSAFHDPDDTANWSRLSHYMSCSRNLTTLSDLTKAHSTLKTGPKEITEVLNNFPAMQFDPDSFSVDVPICQINSLVLIDIGGIFRELYSGLFYFHRSFLLTPYNKNHGEWKIESDMMTISPATQEQIGKSFMSVRRLPPLEMRLKLNPGTIDRNSLIPAFCELTKLTRDYATRFLAEGSWDLERTLQAFIDQLKSNQIPLHAFSI